MIQLLENGKVNIVIELGCPEEIQYLKNSLYAMIECTDIVQLQNYKENDPLWNVCKIIKSMDFDAQQIFDIKRSLKQPQN